MAWHVEKEPDGKEAIVIDGWDTIAPDPYSGTGRMRSVNTTVPREVSVGYSITTSTLSAGGATLGLPIARSTRYFSYTSPGVPAGVAQSFAILDASGQVWESTTVSGTFTFLSNNNSTTGASINDGLVYWMGYLWKFRNTSIDYWNGTIWVNGWNPTSGGSGSSGQLTGSVRHFAYVATDNGLYFTDNNYVGAIIANTPLTSFDPTNTATYTFSSSTTSTEGKLQLPANDSAVSIGEIGSGSASNSLLLIGGSANAIYPWDKTSPSFQLPIYVADPYIWNIVGVNQNAFIFPGQGNSRGRIYITNGSQADLFFKMPDYIFNIQDPIYLWGDAMFHRNELVFGCFVEANATTRTKQSSSNIWALNLETKQFRGISRISNVSLNANATALISGDTSSTGGAGFNYIIGWNDNDSTYHIGYSGTTAGIGSGDIITELIPVGTFLRKRTFQEVEYKLRTPLASGESISISPVVDGVEGTALTFSPTPDVNQFSGIAPVNFEGAQWLSFDITLTGNSASSGVRLKEIRIR